MTRTRKRPAVSDRATSTTTTLHPESSLHHRQDGYSAPTPDDRLDAEVIDAAKARGFAIAVRCTRCGQWVVAAKSVAAHLGPVCRAKLDAEAVSQ
ncbi:MAG: hypothetical protein KDB56_10750 [Mycobacterium sp.]|nr:hypothetical protein [Mycobacterium sp.]